MSEPVVGCIGGPYCGRALEKRDTRVPGHPDRIDMQGVGTYVRMYDPPSWMSMTDVVPGVLVYLWSQLKDVG